jgi:hypothetical protein
MNGKSLVTAGVACLLALTAAQSALASPRARSAHKPIEVERRSFLDPGTKVVVGSTNRYMVQQTFSNQDPVYANQRGWYMGETLPRRWYNQWAPGIPFESPTFDE